jgi:hypothetical protein
MIISFSLIIFRTITKVRIVESLLRFELNFHRIVITLKCKFSHFIL